MSLLVNQTDWFTVGAQGAGGESEPAGYSVQVSDYATAYVAPAPNFANRVYVVPKKAGSVTVTVSGHSADGTALPPITRSYEFDPLPLPQATQFVLGADSSDNINQAPADPGTDTITGSC